MIKPNRLKKGDCIGVVCPSMPITSMDKLNKGLREIRKLGLEFELGKTVGQEVGFMAGEDVERADDINRMFERKDIKGIFCGVGGESAIRLLHLLDYEKIANNPKIFMGFSDISILINAIYAKTGILTFHGPNIENGFDLSQIKRPGLGEYTQTYLLQTLFEARNEIVIKPRQRWKTLRAGRAEGYLAGGNLESICAILDTPFMPSWEGKIWFWEEVNTTPATVDFRLREYKLRGVLDKITGMIIGKNWKCYNRGYRVSPTVEQVVLDATKEYDFPILSKVDLGHNCDQCILPIGAKARIDAINQEIIVEGQIVN